MASHEQRNVLNYTHGLRNFTDSLPRSKVLPFEHTDLHAYDEAHRRGHNQANCPQLFPSCTLSLIDFALGQYMHSNSWFR